MRIYALLILFSLILLMQLDADAQCSMCNAVVSSGIEQENGGPARGINRGILFLMAFPYLLLLGFVYYFWGGRIKNYVQKIIRNR